MQITIQSQNCIFSFVVLVGMSQIFCRVIMFEVPLMLPVMRMRRNRKVGQLRFLTVTFSRDPLATAMSGGIRAGG